jgi:hypothetical protein
MNWLWAPVFGRTFNSPIFAGMKFFSRMSPKARQAYAVQRAQETLAEFKRSQELEESSSGTAWQEARFEVRKYFLLNEIYLLGTDRKYLPRSKIEATVTNNFIAWLHESNDLEQPEWASFFSNLEKQEDVRRCLPSLFNGKFKKKWTTARLTKAADREHDTPILAAIEQLRAQMRSTEAFMRSSDSMTRMHLVSTMDAGARHIAQLKQQLKRAIADESIDRMGG